MGRLEVFLQRRQSWDLAEVTGKVRTGSSAKARSGAGVQARAADRIELTGLVP